jgi:hypothetical protein
MSFLTLLQYALATGLIIIVAALVSIVAQSVSTVALMPIVATVF